MQKIFESRNFLKVHLKFWIKKFKFKKVCSLKLFSKSEKYFGSEKFLGPKQVMGAKNMSLQKYLGLTPKWGW